MSMTSQIVRLGLVATLAFTNLPTAKSQPRGESEGRIDPANYQYVGIYEFKLNESRPKVVLSFPEPVKQLALNFTAVAVTGGVTTDITYGTTPDAKIEQRELKSGETAPGFSVRDMKMNTLVFKRVSGSATLRVVLYAVKN